MMGIMKEEVIAMSPCLYNLAGMVVFVSSLDHQSLEWEEWSASTPERKILWISPARFHQTFYYYWRSSAIYTRLCA